MKKVSGLAYKNKSALLDSSKAGGGRETGETESVCEHDGAKMKWMKDGWR